MFGRKPTNFEVYYRPPGEEEHVSVAEALNRIFLKLEELDYRLKILEDKAIY